MRKRNPFLAGVPPAALADSRPGTLEKRQEISCKIPEHTHSISFYVLRCGDVCVLPCPGSLRLALKIINTAKLLQLSRITNADAPHCEANGTNAMLPALFGQLAITSIIKCRS